VCRCRSLIPSRSARHAAPVRSGGALALPDSLAARASRTNLATLMTIASTTNANTPPNSATIVACGTIA
jgi:hypothetical protein